MAELKYRKRVKIIGTVDLILTCMSIALPLLLLGIAVRLTFGVDGGATEGINPEGDGVKPNPPTSPKGISIAAFVVWCLFLISSLFIIIQIFASLMLIRATKPKMDAVKARNRSLVWLYFTILFTVLLALGGLFPRSPLQVLKIPIVPYFGEGFTRVQVGFNFFCVLFRCFGIYIVHKFVKELPLAVPKGISV